MSFKYYLFHKNENFRQCKFYSFLPKLILNRNLEKSAVFLSWFSDFAPHNVARTRELLLKLPKMDKLKLNWVVQRAFPRAVKESSQCLIDDPALIHITQNVNYAELGEGICTALGIINAFEVRFWPHFEERALNFR